MRKRRITSYIKYFLVALVCLTVLISANFLYQTKKQVDKIKKWDSEIVELTKKYHIESYQNVVRAIILTETKGDKIDLMQSSESKYGQQSVIQNEADSLASGIEYLASVIHEGEKQEVDFWASVQAYNFGINYIHYVKEHGNKSTLPLAETYSAEVLAPALGNSSLKTYFYKNPQAIFHNGGYLYENGGNIFYSDLVKWNLKFINFFDGNTF